MGTTALPFHENIVHALKELAATRSTETFIGCVRSLMGTKIPKNHTAIVNAIRENATALHVDKHQFVIEAITHVEAERRANVEVPSGHCRVSDFDRSTSHVKSF